TLFRSKADCRITISIRNTSFLKKMNHRKSMRNVKNGCSAKCAGSTRVSHAARQLTAKQREGIRQSGLQKHDQHSKHIISKENEPQKINAHSEERLFRKVRRFNPSQPCSAPADSETTGRN